MVSTGTVNMSVADLVRCSGSHILDSDVEVQRLARKRVVGVDGYFVSFNLGDRDIHIVLVAFNGEFHADFQFLDAGELLFGDLGDFLFIPLAVAISGRDGDFYRVACIFALERVFKSGNDIAGAVQICKRLLAFRAIDDMAVVVCECVVYGDNRVLCDFHEILLIVESKILFKIRRFRRSAKEGGFELQTTNTKCQMQFTNAKVHNKNSGFMRPLLTYVFEVLGRIERFRRRVTVFFHIGCLEHLRVALRGGLWRCSNTFGLACRARYR